MECPLCTHKLSSLPERCPECGASLRFLRAQPRRVWAWIHVSIGLGAALLAALAWVVYAPLARGERPGGDGFDFWWIFGIEIGRAHV